MRGNKVIKMTMHHSEMSSPVKALCTYGKVVIQSPIGVQDQPAYEREHEHFTDDFANAPNVSSETPRSVPTSDSSTTSNRHRSACSMGQGDNFQTNARAAGGSSANTSCNISANEVVSESFSSTPCAASTHAPAQGDQQPVEKQMNKTQAPSSVPLRQRVSVSSFSMGASCSTDQSRAKPPPPKCSTTTTTASTTAKNTQLPKAK